MAIVITNDGKAQALSYLISKDTSVENLYLKLYSNDATPDATSSATTFTEVSTSYGYSSTQLTGTNWTVVNGQASYPQITWNFTGNLGNIYGYYVVNELSNKVVFAERFESGPYNVANNGDIVRISLTLNLV